MANEEVFHRVLYRKCNNPSLGNASSIADEEVFHRGMRKIFLNEMLLLFQREKSSIEVQEILSL